MMRSAGLTWIDDADVEQSYDLVHPLLNIRPAIRRATWMRETVAAAVHTAKAPTPANEIEGDIRFAGPSALLDLLSDCVGREITYYEERDGLRFIFPSILVDVSPGGVGEVGVDADPDRHGYGEFAARIRLRRVDGGRYEPIFQPLDPVYLAPDEADGFEFSDQAAGALVWVDDGGVGYRLSDAGAEAAVMRAFPSDGGIGFYGN